MVLVVAVVMAGLGYAIGDRKGRRTEGIILGLVLGLIGIVILLCLKPKRDFDVPYHLLTANQPISQWGQDPYGRHEYRWWDGRQWSDQVSDRGINAVDPLPVLALPRGY